MRVIFAVILFVTLFLSDNIARLMLVLNAPHLAPLVIPAERNKLVSHLNYDGYFVTEDYAGTLYHVKNNLRQVVGQPLVYKHTIWIFGNSGAFGLYVSDADTMESNLQKLFPDERIVNAAAPGEFIAGEYAKLKTLPIRLGDLVIFDDGGMDLVYGRCTDNHFAVLQLICQTTYDNTTSIADFNRIAKKVQSYAIQHGAMFYHFLQPTPYPQYEQGVQVQRLVVPDKYLMDAYHLTPEGERLEAQEIFSVLTSI